MMITNSYANYKACGTFNRPRVIVEVNNQQQYSHLNCKINY